MNMSKYLRIFAYLLTGLYLLNASWRAGIGLIITGGVAAIGPDFLIFLAINLVGLYYLLTALADILGVIKDCAGYWTKTPTKRKSK